MGVVCIVPIQNMSCRAIQAVNEYAPIFIRPDTDIALIPLSESYRNKA